MKTYQNKVQPAQEKRSQATPEGRLRLAAAIRAENMDNRMKIRQREKLLYGEESLPPLFNKADAAFVGGGYEEGYNAEKAPSSVGAFKLRMGVAVVLFVAFLFCDAGNYKIWGYSTNDIYAMITEDYFNIYRDKASNEQPQLTELFNLSDL